MPARFLTWSIIAGIALTGGLMAHKDGKLEAWKLWFKEWSRGDAAAYSHVRFQVDLVDRLNYVRLEARQPVLRVDLELENWLETHFPEMVLDDIQHVTQTVQNAVPRYFRVSVCTASGPTMRALLDQFHEFSRETGPEMTHLACAVRRSVGGLSHHALLVVGQRLEDFSPEIIAASQDETFFSICPHCEHPHVVRISRQQHSLGLECPQCRRTYAVVAGDKAGSLGLECPECRLTYAVVAADENSRFRYVNEFLTGYAPPAVFAKDHSRVHELFTIWSAVHANCVYTKDPGAQKEATDAWQTSLETQRLGQGDEVQAVRRAVELLERRCVDRRRLRQEGEDAAAVVVHEHDGGVERVQPRGEQAVHVVIERQVADDEGERAVPRLGRLEGRQLRRRAAQRLIEPVDVLADDRDRAAHRRALEGTQHAGKHRGDVAVSPCLRRPPDVVTTPSRISAGTSSAAGTLSTAP